MSSLLWKAFHQDDVDGFRHILETASYNVRDRSHTQKSHGSGQGSKNGAFVGSPGSYLASSPISAAKVRKSGATTTSSAATALTLTRADVNGKDANGLTLLHHAATGDSEQSLEFATALIHHPLTDLHIQDLENGWTALHRALYFGNICVALAILNRETEDSLSHGPGNSSKNLIKIKDKDGNGPFDLLGLTIGDHRSDSTGRIRRATSLSSDEDTISVTTEDGERRPRLPFLCPQLLGDELYTFGSNKNTTLGFGDEDDRQFPERITLRRPLHLLHRFHKEHIEFEAKKWSLVDRHYSEKLLAELSLPKPPSELPAVIRNKPIVIQDVQMSKLHTAVITADPESNLYICGHGPGGRLGTGSEATQFGFASIEGGALAHKRVVRIALGCNHTIALSDDGEVFSWGSNTFGQLGHGLIQSPTKDDEPIQTLPRQIFGPLKRECIRGIAASRIHTVAFTSSSLYTFGKNEGQLGIMDSDARTLACQAIPRKVGASLFPSSIDSVCAIDRATGCLLENRDVWVFANHGYTKLSLSLGAFTNYFLKDTFLTTRYDALPTVTKIAGAGDTICALTSAGDIYAVLIGSKPDGPASDTPTNNPNKNKNIISHLHKIWSPRKNNMRARDVDVDQDGSIILTTEAGSAWRRIRRTKIKDASAAGTGEYQPKNYKFSRIPSLLRVAGVRASGFGAYAAVGMDCGIMRSSVIVEEKTLWKDILPLLPFHSMTNCVPDSDSDDENPPLRFWQSSKRLSDIALIRQHILAASDPEKDLIEHIRQTTNDLNKTCDMVLRCTNSNVCIPMHSFLFCSRSRVIRQGLAQFHRSHFFSIPNTLSIEYTSNGEVLIRFKGLDLLSLVNLVFYLYTDSTVDFWHHTKGAPKLARRYRQIRVELMALASKLEMPNLEPAVRQMIEPKRSLDMDMEYAFREGILETSGDIIVQLKETEVRVVNALVCQRCPFFEGLFNGRAHGRWLDNRRGTMNDAPEVITVDLKHVEPNIFSFVLRHIYADAGEELFDDVISDDLDSFLDLVVDVLGVANELMLDRLSQICQKVIGRYTTIRNAASLLNAIAPSAVSQFKDAGLEYLTWNLEVVLENALLNELDADLLQELDDKVKNNQRQTLKNVRGDLALAELLDRLPDLPTAVELDKRARIDGIMIQAKYFEGNNRIMNSIKSGSADELQLPSLTPLSQRKSSKGMRSAVSPEIKGNIPSSDMLFDMDDESTMLPEAATKDLSERQSAALKREAPLPNSPPTSPHLKVWLDSKGKSLPTSQDLSVSNPSPSPSPLDTRATFTATVHKSPDLKTPNTAWGASPLHSTKLGLKEIMAQASTSRTSNISLALSSQSNQKVHDKGSTQPVSRMSQKDRKKLQHVQRPAEPDKSSDNVPPSEPTSTTPPEATNGPAWQATTKGPRITLKDVFSEEMKTQPAETTDLLASRNGSVPQLNVDHVDSSNMATNKDQKNSKNHAGQSPTQQRSVSSPQPPGGLSSNRASALQTSKTPPSRSISTPITNPTSSSPSAPPPAIRSISHIQNPLSAAARAAEPTLGLSMSEIVSQQQAEKDIVREATTAKRNLEDIQLEQEFQKWWDLESRKVQGIVEEVEEGNEADASGKRANGQSKSRRGGGRGRGKGKRTENTRPDENNRARSNEAATPMRGDKGRQSRRGKDDGRRVAPDKQNSTESRFSHEHVHTTAVNT